YPRRTAMWSTIVAALVPGYLLCSTEFRTDDLWTLFWIASVAMLVCAPRRTFLSGLFLGLAAATSAKTLLLLVAVGIGGVVVLVAIAAKYAYRGAADRDAGARRLFLFVTANFYAASMFCLWPLVEREHWLPYYPLAAITIVPLVARASVRRYAVIAAVEIALVIFFGDLRHNRAGRGLAVVAQTLRLTAPNETVMDLKGETVFRQRAFFYVLEPMTKYRMRTGLIADTIVDDILRTHTMVATATLRGFPRRARAFLARNFIAV